MGDVFKNLAKLLGVALLAGLLGALGGILVNHFIGDDEPQGPAPATSSQTIAVPSAAETESAPEGGAPATEQKTEEAEQTAQEPPDQTGDKETASSTETATRQPPAPKEDEPEKAEQPAAGKAAPGISETDLKEADKPEDKPAREKAPEESETVAQKETEKAGPETGSKEEPKPEPKTREKPAASTETKEKPGQEQAAPGKETKESDKSVEKQADKKADKPKDKSKPLPFDKMVEEEKKKEKVLQVRSVTASTVDENVVLRVALDRSAEPKMSRLVSRGQLRIILDFENAVRKAGKVPDVIKTSNPAIKAIRIGAHPDKIRIVLDLDPELTYALNQHRFSKAYVLEIKPKAK